VRRGNNVPGRGFPGCRDGGFKNSQIPEVVFEENWRRAFGHVGPLKGTVLPIESNRSPHLSISDAPGDGTYRFPARGD